VEPSHVSLRLKKGNIGNASHQVDLIAVWMDRLDMHIFRLIQHQEPQKFEVFDSTS
jgi:hypothetical protein